MTPKTALRAAQAGRSPTSQAIKRIYDEVEGRDERFELNLYISGRDEDLLP